MSLVLLHSYETTGLSCGKCVKTLNDADKVLLCDLCDASFHISCLHIEVTTYTKIYDLKGVVKWFCDDCNKRIEDLKVQQNINDSIASADRDIWDNNLGDKFFAKLCAIERKLDEQLFNVNKQCASIVKSLNIKNEKINTDTDDKNSRTIVMEPKKLHNLDQTNSDVNNKDNQLSSSEVIEFFDETVHEDIVENITKCEKDPLDISTIKGNYIKQEAVLTEDAIEELTESVKEESYLEDEATKCSLAVVEDMAECSADTSVFEGHIDECTSSNRGRTLSPVLENMDVLTLQTLDENDITNLFPSIGHRARFRAKLKSWKEDMKTAEASDVYCLPTASSEKNNLLLPSENLDNKIKSKVSTPAVNKVDQPAVMKENHVLKILNKSFEGKSILSKAAKSGGKLDNLLRRKVAQIIIRHELDDDPSRVINGTEFTKLSLQVAEVFPQEVPIIYYTAYSAADNFRPKKNASGKLYEAYVSRRRKLRSLGEIFKGNYFRSSTSIPSTSKQCSNMNLIYEDDNTSVERIEWLKNSIEPWHLVKKYWQSTQNARMKILEEEGTVADYFKKFPALKTTQGFRLLMADFSNIYPGKENNLFSNIILHKQKIIEIAEEKVRTSKDKDLRDTINSYLSLLDHKKKDGNQDVETNVALILLPYITPLRLTKKVKQVWQPSRTEVRDGFIIHISSERLLESTLVSRKEKLLNLGCTIQPLIVCIGETIASVSAAYVIVDEIHYKFPSLLTAVDTAFKIFHSTSAKYPMECEIIWLIIQVGFYKIETKYDRLTSGVNSFLVDLGLKPIE